MSAVHDATTDPVAASGITIRGAIRRIAGPSLVLGLVLTPAWAADAAVGSARTTTAAHYANCAAVHRVYSGGIARAGVTSNTVRSGGRITHRPLAGSVKFSTALYLANSSLDRDKDGIACELS